MSADWTNALAETVAAQRTVAATPSWTRAGWLAAVADGIEAEADALANLIVTEGVKTIREAQGEVARAALTFRFAAQEVGRDAGTVLALDRAPNGTGRIGTVLRRPLGVVFGITPFNDPLNLVAHKVAPALAAGNAILVKPHERTPGVAERLVAICRAAGVPEGAVATIRADHPATAALIADPRVAMVSFTGGRIAGAAVARAAAGKPTSLEMGGVASTIVLADADLERAAPLIVSGMVAAAGQNCLHVQRVIAEDGIYDALLSALVGGVEAIRLGDRTDPATDMGRLIDTRARDRCSEWVAEAVAAGAGIATGGTAQGETFVPTILTDVPPDCRIAREEVFGPVTVVERVPDLDAAVAAAARTGPALAAGLFTARLDAPGRVATLPVGQVVVNDSSDFRVDHMPFGGPGAAGLGREGIKDAIDAMSDAVLICYEA